MSVSLLYHAHCIKDIQYKSTTYKEGNIVFNAEMKKSCFPCPKCGCLHYHFKGKKVRIFQTLPFSRKKCFLKVTIHRLQCDDCKKIFWPTLNFMKGKRRMTKAFIKYVLDLLKLGTIKDAANFLSLSWDVVKDLHKEKLNIFYRKINYKKLRYIGVDEFSIKKGHNYMTVFTNLETGQIIYAVEGRKKKVLKNFLKRLKRHAINLKAIAMDMSGSYYSAVTEFLPGIDVVFDHFHVSALMNKALDDVRKEQMQKDKEAIKGSKYLLLKNYENLDLEKKDKLKYLLEINQPIATAYALKEQLRLFWKKPDVKTAAEFLFFWIVDAFRTKIEPLKKAAGTLIKYHVGLLNYFKHNISNAITEGINNKIKTLKRQAYGFRDMGYFKLRLYHLHKQKYSLSG